LPSFTRACAIYQELRLSAAFICDSLPIPSGVDEHDAIANRAAFVHPSIDLAPKVVVDRGRFDHFVIPYPNFDQFSLTPHQRSPSTGA
jgi:hypothetical protein